MIGFGLVGLIGDNSVFNGVVLMKSTVILAHWDGFEYVNIGSGGGRWGSVGLSWFGLYFRFGFPLYNER